MKKLVPEILINDNIYSETQFNTIHAVIELARLNAAMILKEYVPILYMSTIYVSYTMHCRTNRT